jgi:transcriptional regulator with XRE-family HTH domain
MSQTTRPIELHEVPHLEALGQGLRALREQLGLDRREMARRTGLAQHHLYCIETGRTRTRASTLEWLATCLTDTPETAQRVAAELTALAGPAIAPEAPRRFQEKRLARWHRQARPSPTHGGVAPGRTLGGDCDETMRPL